MKVKLLVDRALDFRRGRIEIGNTKLRPNRISQRTPKLTAINELPDWAIANIVNVWEIDSTRGGPRRCAVYQMAGLKEKGIFRRCFCHIAGNLFSKFKEILDRTICTNQIGQLPLGFTKSKAHCFPSTPSAGKDGVNGSFGELVNPSNP